MGGALMQFQQRQHDNPERHQQTDHHHRFDAILQPPGNDHGTGQSDNQRQRQPFCQLLRFIATPAHQRADPHQQRKRCHQPAEHRVEEGFTDRDAAQPQLLVNQRQQRAEQDYQHRGNQQHVITQQKRFPRPGFILNAATHLPAFNGVEQQ